MTGELLFAAVALAVIVLGHVKDARHAAALARKDAVQDAERHAWARERNELNTRIQSPEVSRVAPPPPPPSPAEVEAVFRAAGVTVNDPDDDEGDDESHLIGEIVGYGSGDSA